MEIEMYDMWKVDVTDVFTKIIIDTRYFSSIKDAREFVNSVNTSSDDIKAIEPFKIY